MSFDPAQPTLAQAIQLHQAGRLDQAESIYRQLLTSSPENANILHLLGMLLFQKGQRTEGLAHLRRAVNADPTVAIYHLNFGSALAQDGKVQEAIAETRKALALAPNDAQAHFNLAHLLETCEQWDRAATSYRQAIQLRPDFAPAHNNLGNVLYSLGRSQEAELCYRAALAYRPLDPKTHKNLGRTLHDLGRLPEAADTYRRAMELDPSDAEAHTNLGTVLASSRQFDQAISEYQTALSLRPDDTAAMTNLGNALKETARLDEAVTVLSRALDLGGDARTGSCLNVLVHLHPDYDPRRIWQVHEKWEERFARPLAPIGNFYPNDPSPLRRLRIGYVSPQFGDQIVGHCILQLFKNHDHTAFEIYCYSDTRRTDWMTERLRPTADVWRNTVGLSDEQLTALVRQDHIDILVDLNMHMERNRMLVFARKPAPVQITWIGYPSTTGLRTIDYRLSDAYLDPPGPNGAPGEDEQFYSEKTIRLPDSYWCYQPLDDLPPPSELPTLQNRYITFGCLNSFVKVSEPSLRLWARVLREVKNSRLILLAPEGSARQRVLDILNNEGIDANRIVFFDRHPRRKYMELYHQIDLGLDTTPYTGHTTTLDSLWMGVPVISITGRTAVSRGGLSILSNAGLSDFCARSEEGFVAKAVAVASDLSSLRELRRTLRQRMAASPLLDGARFARAVESSYRQAWTSWCALQNTVRVTEQAPDRYHVVTLGPTEGPDKSWEGFAEVSKLLRYSLESLGFPTTEDRNLFRPDAINIVLGYQILKPPVDGKWIPFQLEQLDVEGRDTSDMLHILSTATEIWDYDPGNIQYLQSHGIHRARHVPLGFHPNLKIIPHREKDIDVLHYGAGSQRRSGILEALSKRCRLVSVAGVFGNERDELIARSKLVLNIHRFEAPIFEQVRVSYLLNNGACVVTEDSPYNPYRDMTVTCPYDQIVDRCLALLSNEPERRMLAEAGARKFEKMPMTDILSHLAMRATFPRAASAPH